MAGGLPGWTSHGETLDINTFAPYFFTVWLDKLIQLDKTITLLKTVAEKELLLERSPGQKNHTGNVKRRKTLTDQILLSSPNKNTS